MIERVKLETLATLRNDELDARLLTRFPLSRLSALPIYSRFEFNSRVSPTLVSLSFHRSIETLFSTTRHFIELILNINPDVDDGIIYSE